MKKLTKKLVTAILTGAMVFSLGAIPTFAAQGNDGQIIITNPNTEVTYSAYKIFDLDYSGTNHAYTINSGSDFFVAVQKYANASDTTDADGLTLTQVGSTTTQVGSTTTYNVTIDDLKFSAAKFGAAMEDVVDETINADATENDNTTTKNLSLSNTLSYGYYLVIGTKGETVEALVSLDSTNKIANIVEKNDVPGWHSDEPGGGTGKTIKTETKNDEGESVVKYVETTDMNVGDTVTFAIKIDAKNYNGKNLITKYIIKDSLPDGFTFGEIKSVMVGDTVLASTAYTNNSFPTDSIEIPWATESDDGFWTSKYDPSTLITIEYTATLSSDAVIDGAGNVNKAVFTYEYGSTPENPTPDPDPEIPENPSQWENTDTAKVYTYAIALKKIDKNGNPLAGATFRLPTDMKVSEVADKTNTYVVDPEGDIESITTSGTDASFTIIGVAAGTYEFTETAAPAGYNKLTSPVPVEAKKIGETATTTNTTFYLNENGEVTDTVTDTTVTYKNDDYAVTPVAVVNFTGTELPSTGGMGTTIFYVVGAILVIGAGVILITKRRMSAR